MSSIVGFGAANLPRPGVEVIDARASDRDPTINEPGDAPRERIDDQVGERPMLEYGTEPAAAPDPGVRRHRATALQTPWHLPRGKPAVARALQTCRRQHQRR